MKITIVGAGKVGLYLAHSLCEENHDITVIDINSLALARVQESCDALAVQGHGATRGALDEAGTAEAELLIATTGSDEINLLGCLMARKMGCLHTIARVRNPEYAADVSLLREDLGLSFAINPEEACAREIYQILQYPSFLERDLFAKGRVEIVGMKIGPKSPLAGSPLSELYRITKHKMLVCAVERDTKVIIPSGSFTVQEGDDLHITAARENLPQLMKAMGLSNHKISHVTIVGGSRLAVYLTRGLLRSGVGVKIIEKDRGQCQKLAGLLPKANIIHADGTELEVLHSERVDQSDAVVALTGIDEENLVLSMYLKKIGVPKIVTKSNRLQYTGMFEKLGLESVVSPTITSGEDIIRYVRSLENSSGGQMQTMHTIVGGKVEAMEFRADESFLGLGAPLRNLTLKEGLLVACISRGGQILIPDGTSAIKTGDSVVIVSAEHFIQDLNDILVAT